MPKIINKTDKHVGARVRMRRLQLGLSQEKLADGLDLTFQQVQKYEKGMNRIGASRMQQIATILKVPVSFFFEELPAIKIDGAPSTLIDEFTATGQGVQIMKAWPHIAPKVRAELTGLINQLAKQPATA